MAKQFLSMFEIMNRTELDCSYRLLEITGLPRKEDDKGVDYYKNINILLRRVAYELRKPVALVSKDGKHYLAIPADSPQPQHKRPLILHVAQLVPVEGVNHIKLDSLDTESMPIALQFLGYAFRTPLMRDKMLWNVGRSYFWKMPINYKDETWKVDIFEGFKFNILSLESGRLFLAIDITYKYVDPRWLTELANDGSEISEYVNRHFVYHFGHDWYQIQLIKATGKTVRDQEFTHRRTGKTFNLFDYIMQEHGKDRLPYIQSLDPRSPAILYRDPGSKIESYGAAALCKLIYPTEAPKVKTIHFQSIQPPNKRFAEVSKIVQRHFANAELNGKPICLKAEPFQAEHRFFPVPDQLFGNNTVLHVKRDVADRGIDLRELGQIRMRYLLDRKIGPLTISPFDAQYIIRPLSLPRPIVEDFTERFKQSMCQFYPHHPYQPKLVLYDDRGCQTLQSQVKAIQTGFQKAGVSKGYALLVLPPNADKDLHNYIKRALWPDIQLQCALASNIVNFYQQQGVGEQFTYEVKDGLEGKLRSYIKYTALGLLQVNHKWLWSLQNALHYDAYVGIDVLKGTAGFTFIYENSKYCFFHDFPSRQKEKLPANQIKEVLYTRLKDDLRKLFCPPLICPHSIVIHRDGKIYESELRGIRAAVRQLKREGILNSETMVGVVQIPKQSAYPIRISIGDSLARLDNPRIGGWFPIDMKQGIVCTTGKPFIRQGTARPLHAIIAEGELNIKYVLEDIFALSQLIWSAPDSCGRLPLTIRLAHEFLEPMAAEADIGRALYGEGEIFEKEEEEIEEVTQVDVG